MRYRHGNIDVDFCIFICTSTTNKYIDLFSLECETFIDYLTIPLTGCCDTMYRSIVYFVKFIDVDSDVIEKEMPYHNVSLFLSFFLLYVCETILQQQREYICHTF